MYANLKVRWRSDLGDGFMDDYAWNIERDGDKLVISLDANDGEGNYAVEAGEVRIDPADLISVEASF